MLATDAKCFDLPGSRRYVIQSVIPVEASWKRRSNLTDVLKEVPRVRADSGYAATGNTNLSDCRDPGCI